MLLLKHVSKNLVKVRHLPNIRKNIGQKYRCVEFFLVIVMKCKRFYAPPLRGVSIFGM